MGVPNIKGLSIGVPDIIIGGAEYQQQGGAIHHLPNLNQLLKITSSEHMETLPNGSKDPGQFRNIYYPD